ncbi:DUF6624 domain-containing protein [Streptomyces sp. NPDC058657]|uniref:DUF6624 domain-containing protein n=1 Tax=unclassified Streptomyces TaxID=2593676 RepID=UPI003653B06D
MTPPPVRRDIARDLVDRANASMQYRSRLVRGLLTSEEEEMGALQERANAVVLRRLLHQHGWPGHTLVGEAGATAAWRLALHAEREPDLQHMALRMLTTATEHREATIQQWAHLHDRCNVTAGHPQLYGTQHRFRADGSLELLPVSSPDTLDVRRRSVGLPPVTEVHDALRLRYAPRHDGDQAEPDPPVGHRMAARADLVGASA